MMQDLSGHFKMFAAYQKEQESKYQNSCKWNKIYDSEHYVRWWYHDDKSQGISRYCADQYPLQEYQHHIYLKLIFMLASTYNECTHICGAVTAFFLYSTSPKYNAVCHADLFTLGDLRHEEM